MNIFEMLILNKRMVFETGRITLYGQEISVFPVPSIIEYIAQVNENKELVKLLYSTAKEAMINNKQELAKAYKASEGARWICSIINLYAHGRITYENNVQTTGVILLENSPYASALKNRASGPVDHILRGFIAGVASSVLDKDLDVIETECSVDGSSSCKLVLDSKETLIGKFPSVCEAQI